MFKILVIVGFFLNGAQMAGQKPLLTQSFSSLSACADYYENQVGPIARLRIPGLVKEIKGEGIVYSVTIACLK